MCSEERELIVRYQPRILMDRADPFPVRFLGCTVFSEPGVSPSFRGLLLDPKALGARYIIEYAVYFDYDIQHLYDLEHIWVIVAADGHVTECWSSYHGMRMRASGLKSFRLEGTHPVLYCQPGKHAFLPDPELFRLHCQYDTCCRETAGGGLLIPGMLRDRLTTDPQRDEKIRAYIRENFSFSLSEDYIPQNLEDGQFITWQELLDAIPGLVEDQLKIIES
jgi:hypothetical protein